MSVTLATMRDLEPGPLQPPPQDVEDDLLADVPDVRRALHGEAAVVDADLALDERHEVAHRPGGGVVQAEAHPGKVTWGTRRLSPRARWRSRRGPRRGRSGRARRSWSPTPTPGAAPRVDSAASASARRGPIFGRLPTTCTATLPTSKPAARPAGRSRRAASTPEAPAHCGSVGAEDRAEVAEPGGGEQRVAGGVRGDVAVGVPGAAGGLVREVQPGQVQRPARLERVHVDADADPGQAQPPACLRPAQHGLGQQQVERPGHLERLLGPGHDDHDGRRPLDQPGVVGRRRAAPARRAPRRAPRAGSPAGSAPRAGPTRSTVADHRRRPVDPLDRVGDRQAGHDGVRTARARRRPRRRPASTGTSGAGRVVHQHDVDRRSAAPPGRARTDSCRVAPPATTDELGARRAHRRAARAPRRPGPAGAATTTRSTGPAAQGAHGVHEQRLAAEQAQRLGAAGAEPLAAPAAGTTAATTGAVDRPASRAARLGRTPSGRWRS